MQAFFSKWYAKCATLHGRHGGPFVAGRGLFPLINQLQFPPPQLLLPFLSDARGQIGIVTEFIGIIKRWENPSRISFTSENIKQFAARRRARGVWVVCTGHKLIIIGS